MTSSFPEFCTAVDPDSPVTVEDRSLRFSNRSGKTWPISFKEVDLVLRRFLEKNAEIESYARSHATFVSGEDAWTYHEKIFRGVFERFFDGPAYSTATGYAGSQTKGLVTTLSKVVGWSIDNRACAPTDPLLLDRLSLEKYVTAGRDPTAAADSSGVVAAFRAVCEFNAAYNNHVGGWARNDARVVAATRHLAKLTEWLQRTYGRYRGTRVEVEYAEGMGLYPKIPYICLLPPNQRINDGVYVAICFGKEGAGAVAGFARSVKEQAGFPAVRRQRPIKIDVDGPTPAARYNDCFNNPKEFESARLNVTDLQSHIEHSLELCMDFLKDRPAQLSSIPATVAPTTQATVASVPFDGSHLRAFQAALAQSGFRCTPEFAASFIASLAAKPFVILSGNSGTGKTKLAEQFVTWLLGADDAGYALVPVGADWTDNRNVLGFVNHLRTTTVADSDRQSPIYQSTRILDLLLAASVAPAKPHFLVLDEMNLSHVERYFADLLSTMESRNGELLLHREGMNLPRRPGGIADVPELFRLPPNVFVIGTVNVDETTYMFSPKVLDRANVLEFRVEDSAPLEFLESGAVPIAVIATAPRGSAESFLQLSLRARGYESKKPLPLSSNPEVAAVRDALTECRTTIVDLFALMRSRNQEFAFRSMTEILRFLAVDFELTTAGAEWDWKSALDRQILQKVLPKLHGSKRRIGSLLASLATYCHEGNKAAAMRVLEVEGSGDAYATTGPDGFATPLLARSHRKLCQMIDAIRRDQFVSFIQ